eukprot:g8215.t1
MFIPKSMMDVVTSAGHPFTVDDLSTKTGRENHARVAGGIPVLFLDDEETPFPARPDPLGPPGSNMRETLVALQNTKGTRAFFDGSLVGDSVSTVLAGSDSTYGSSWASFIYYCRDTDADFRIPPDRLIANWLYSIGLGMQAHSDKASLLRSKLAAVNNTFELCRGWNFSGSLEVKTAIATIQKERPPDKSDSKPHRDVLLFINHIAGWGRNADLSFDDIVRKCVCLVAIDMAARRQLVRGIQRIGPNFFFADSDMKRVDHDDERVAMVRFRYLYPKDRTNTM